MTSKTLAIWLAAMAALQFVAGASNLVDLMGPTLAAWFQLTVGALQVASAVYVGKKALTPADEEYRKIAGQRTRRTSKV